MLIQNWTALAVLIFLCVLILLLAVYIIHLLKQWQPPRASQRDESTVLTHTAHFQVNPLRAPQADAEHTRALWDTLTKREKEVARLAARKLSDVQIAAELHISERTVGNHLYSIYSKLEIHSRHELQIMLSLVES